MNPFNDPRLSTTNHLHPRRYFLLRILTREPSQPVIESPPIPPPGVNLEQLPPNQATKEEKCLRRISSLFCHLNFECFSYCKLLLRSYSNDCSCVFLRNGCS